MAQRLEFSHHGRVMQLVVAILPSANLAYQVVFGYGQQDVALRLRAGLHCDLKFAFAGGRDLDFGHGGPQRFL